MWNRSFISLLVGVFALSLTACHDDDAPPAPVPVVPNPPLATYSIGGTAAGLTGALSLQNANGNALNVEGDGAFTFATQMVSGATYNVTAAVPPNGQSCTVANGSGTVALANVTNVTITCVANPFSLGGTVSGLGAGKTVVLRASTDFMAGNVTVSANGAFTFPLAFVNNAEYEVLVFTQPADQTCTVANGAGDILGASVTNIAVTCTNNSASARNWGNPASLAADDDLEDNDSFRTPKVGFDAAGNALAIWEQDRDGALGSELYFSRYVVGGSWSTPGMIPNQSVPIPGQPSTSTRRKPQLAVAANGNAVAAWVESVHSVSASLYSPGSGWSTPEHLYDNLVTGLGGTIVPKVAMDASGNVLVVWENNMVGAGRHIQYNRYSPGTGWTAPANLGRLVSELQFAAREPEIAILPNGNAIAIWVQGGGGGFDQSQLWSSRYDMTTDTWSAPQAVDTHDSSNLLYGGAVVGRKSVVMDAAGTATAVWAQSDDTRLHIVFNRLTGNTWGTPAIVETYTNVIQSSNAYDVLASIDGSGNIMAMWLQVDSVVGHYVANRYVPGTGWGTQVNIGNYVSVGHLANDTSFELVSNVAGQTVAVWSLVSGIGPENVPDPVYLWANEYNPANNSWGVEEVIDRDTFSASGQVDGDAASPALAVDASGNAIAVWMQENSATLETLEGIRVNRFE
jgi:hypothetical protein